MFTSIVDEKVDASALAEIIQLFRSALLRKIEREGARRAAERLCHPVQCFPVSSREDQPPALAVQIDRHFLSDTGRRAGDECCFHTCTSYQDRANCVR